MLLLYFPEDAAVQVPPTARLAGLPIAERVVRAARRAGHDRILVWLPAGARVDARVEPLLQRLDVEVLRTPEAWRRALEEVPASTAVTAVGPGTVASAALFDAAALVIPRDGQFCDVPAGGEWRETGVLRLTAADAVAPERTIAELALRRARALPLPTAEAIVGGRAKLALRITTPAELRAAERTIRRASYKDTDSTLARFNRRLSLPISVALVSTPLTANGMSLLLVAIGFYAAWLFSRGEYWTGLAAAFLSRAACILDGCDGEIARLKYQDSALGCWIETVGDYSYYLAIFAGLTVGAVRQTGWRGFYWIGGIALAGTVLAFALLIFLRSRITAGRPERLHAIAAERFSADAGLWARVVWRLSFVATRAAMPYGIAAFAVAGLLPGIVVLAAVGANVYWIALVTRLRDLVGGPVARSVGSAA